MGTRKSAELKLLQSTNRPCRAPQQSLAQLEVAPSPPAYLSAAAVAEWERIALAVAQVGITGADIRALALLCETLASEQSLRETINREGSTIQSGDVTKAHPALAALDRSRQIAAKMLESFGLNPRGRVALPPPPKSREPNPFLQFVHDD